MRGEIFRELRSALEAERLVALATVIAGPAPWLGRQLLLEPERELVGDLGHLAGPVATRARELFQSFRSECFTVEVDAECVDVFIEVLPPRPRLVIVGAVHVAIPLVSFARELGMSTHVVDPRIAFATPERFSHADELLTDWPDVALEKIGLNASTYVALLSHDLKLDIPALEVALPSEARYIGALGSKKTHHKRLAALAEAGVSDELAARIHNPIGLDLGGRRAEEMAVAILAEVVAVSHGIGIKPRPAISAR